MMATTTRPMEIRDDTPDDIRQNSFLEWISPALLFVDESYARPIVQATLDRLKSDWNWRALTTLSVSLRPGPKEQYAILDGRHRYLAALALNIKELPCRVQIDLTVEEESLLVPKLNDQRHFQPIDRFRANLRGGDPEAVEVAAICAKEGIPIDMSGSGYRGRAVAISTILAIYREAGAMRLSTVMAMLKLAFGNEERVAVSAAIGGMSLFIARYAHVAEMARVVLKLKQTGPDVMLRKARAQHADNGGTVASGWGRALRAEYNKGLSPEKRLGEWEERHYTEEARARIKASTTAYNRSESGRERARQNRLAVLARKRNGQH